MKTPEIGICSLCRGPYVRWGNNPAPLGRVEDRCCDGCNSTKVLPARIANIQAGKPVY